MQRFCQRVQKERVPVLPSAAKSYAKLQKMESKTKEFNVFYAEWQQLLYSCENFCFNLTQNGEKVVFLHEIWLNS